MTTAHTFPIWRGFKAVLRHELTSFWLPTLIVVSLICALIPVAGSERIIWRSGESGMLFVLAMLALTAPLGIHRLQAESAGGRLLASAPVSPRAILVAKALVTLLEVAVVGVAVALVVSAMHSRETTIAVLPLRFSAIAKIVLAFLWVGTVVFAVFATVRSSWIAGWICLVALLILELSLSSGPSDFESQPALLASILAVLIAALALIAFAGSPWRRIDA